MYKTNQHVSLIADYLVTPSHYVDTNQSTLVVLPSVRTSRRFVKKDVTVQLKIRIRMDKKSKKSNRNKQKGIRSFAYVQVCFQHFLDASFTLYPPIDFLILPVVPPPSTRTKDQYHQSTIQHNTCYNSTMPKESKISTLEYFQMLKAKRKRLREEQESMDVRTLRVEKDFFFHWFPLLSLERDWL